MSVKQLDDPMGLISITRGVGYHYYGSAFLVQLGKQVHYLFPVCGIKISGRLIGKNQKR